MDNKILTLITLPAGATIRDAYQAFDKSGLSIVLICDDEKKLLAIATEGDVRRALLAGQGLQQTLLDSANTDPAIGHTDEPLESLSARITPQRYCIPIVDREGRLADLYYHDQRTFIPVASPTIGERELQNVTDAVLSGWISSTGKYIDLFERKFAEFCHVPHACAVSNGTTALHLALLAAGIQPGDEVILPCLTFISPANAVRYCNAQPVFVDVDEQSWNMDPIKTEEAVTSRTRAIIAVHLYGNPCDMEKLREIADRHNLVLIEDAAEAHGAKIDNRPVGSWGDFACFSFFGNKIFTTGEGGIVITRDKSSDALVRTLRDHGMSKTTPYWHEKIGYNYRMTNLQAAIGSAQIDRAAEILEARDKLRRRYDQALAEVATFTPISKSNAHSVCWLYTILLPHLEGRTMRDQLIRNLKTEGIDTRPVFFPIPAMPPYLEEDWQTRYPTASRISAIGLSLPSMIELSKDRLQRIVETLIKNLP